MNWSTPADLRQQVMRWWERGDILVALLASQSAESEECAPAFPRRLTLKTPTAIELRDHFDAVRQWRQSLHNMPHIRLELRDFRHQVFGQNTLPASAWIDDPQSAVALIGKQREARLFMQICTSTAAKRPSLLAWLAKRPLRALELAADWEKLLAVIDWLLSHPRPGIYLRQMDIPGVHSKFVEAHRGVLGELLDLALPASAIQADATGNSQFNRRYGFLDKPERIRLRWLDASKAPLPLLGTADLTLDAASFAGLNAAVDHVFITENETNFLAFPPVANALLIFGAGYGFAALAGARWLHACTLHYWGDIDSHGFAILDELRSHFPHVESMLMDRATLLAGRALWNEEPTPLKRDLPRLSAEESALYNDLRDNRLGQHLRLEQERIAFSRVLAALNKRLPASVLAPGCGRP